VADTPNGLSLIPPQEIKKKITYWYIQFCPEIYQFTSKYNAVMGALHGRDHTA
jgi:hypothetical protein